MESDRAIVIGPCCEISPFEKTDNVLALEPEAFFYLTQAPIAEACRARVPDEIQVDTVKVINVQHLGDEVQQVLAISWLPSAHERRRPSVDINDSPFWMLCEYCITFWQVRCSRIAFWEHGEVGVNFNSTGAGNFDEVRQPVILLSRRVGDSDFAVIPKD